MAPKEVAKGEATKVDKTPAKEQVLVQSDAPVQEKADAVSVNTDNQPAEVVKSMPGSEYPSPNPPVDPESEEADPNPVPEVKPVTTADNASPGRNAVPVEGTVEGVHSFDNADPETGLPVGYTKADMVPGTNVPQPSAPKSGSLTR